MSKMYEEIKGYFDKGLWKIGRVRDAVLKGRITEEEFFEITGVEY